LNLCFAFAWQQQSVIQEKNSQFAVDLFKVS
jgi:hypothetical protein